jgi:phosphatidylcholine synthase
LSTLTTAAATATVEAPPSLARKAAAWAVHAYTASGAVIAFVAFAMIGEQRFGDAFRWLTLAFAIDCTDGALARAVAVKRVLPYYDGSRLDDIVDYLTYVMVPVVLMYEAACFLPGYAAAVAAAPLLASAYGFCRSDAKTEDHYFRGFPSYWNVVAFYALALRLQPSTISLVVVVLAVLVFAPLKFLYPSRAPRFRALSLALGAVWAAVMLYIVWAFPSTPTLLVWFSLAYPAYYCLMSFWLQATGRA